MTSRSKIAGISDGRSESGRDIWTDGLDRHQTEANLVLLCELHDALLESPELAFNVMDLRDDVSERLSSHWRKTFVVASERHQIVSFRGPPGGDYPEFCKVSTKGIYGSRALPDKKVPGAVNHEHALLLFCLARHEAHAWSLNSFAAGLSIGGIMLVGFDIGPHVASRHQSHIVTELGELAGPEMRSAAGLEADEARRNIGEEAQDLAASEFPSENHLAIDVDAVNLEPGFRRIESDRSNRHSATPCSFGDFPSGCGDRPSRYVRDDKPFGGAGPPAAIFHYSRDRRGEHPQAHLAGYSGILQADAYDGFNPLYLAERKPAPIREAACWAHARGKFYVLADIEENARRKAAGKKEIPLSPIAVEVVSNDSRN